MVANDPCSDSMYAYDEAGNEAIEANAADERDEWAAIKDPVERRRVQNRIAQWKFRQSSSMMFPRLLQASPSLSCANTSERRREEQATP